MASTLGPPGIETAARSEHALSSASLMRRSENLVVMVFCPHFERPVVATRNQTNERLVDCTSKRECSTDATDERGGVRTIYPAGCPVFRVPG